MYICTCMIKLLIKIKLIMSQKSPTGDKIVKVLKWVAWFATAIASFIAGNSLQLWKSQQKKHRPNFLLINQKL